MSMRPQNLNGIFSVKEKSISYIYPSKVYSTIRKISLKMMLWILYYLFSEREKLEGLISSILKITMKIMHLMTDCKIMQQFMEIPALVHEV